MDIKFCGQCPIALEKGEDRTKVRCLVLRKDMGRKQRVPISCPKRGGRVDYNNHPRKWSVVWPPINEVNAHGK